MLRGSLIIFFHLKKTAAESCRLLIEALGEQVTAKKVRRYTIALLDEDASQTLKQLEASLNFAQFFTIRSKTRYNITILAHMLQNMLKIICKASN